MIEENLLRQIVKDSISIRQVLLKMGLKGAGGNYAILNNRLSELGIDISHFRGQGFLKGRTHTWARKHNLEDIFSNNIYMKSYELKKRLLKEKYLEHKCYKCLNIEWLGDSIPLELEHIDGNTRNNNLSNLTLLCPNCHAKTTTYRGRNIKIHKIDRRNKCSNCNNRVYDSRSKRCLECLHLHRRKVENRPSKEELEKMVKEMPMTHIGLKYGVSDNAVRKWIKNYQNTPNATPQ